MIHEFVAPNRDEQIAGYREVPANRWGAAIDYYTGGNIDLEAYHVALIGVGEERGTEQNAGCGAAPDAVRKELYWLVRNEAPMKVVDLGNVRSGQSLTDTYFALASVVQQLLEAKVLPIIIGGSHDLTLAQYMGYEKTGTKVNIALVDERIDLQSVDGATSDENFVAKILGHQPNYLAHYVHLGYQSYFTDAKSINTLEKLAFECLRLGEVRKNMEEVEPLVRDADMLSFDMSAIKQSDAPAHRAASPNGFTGEEACQVTRYAGLSDRLTSLGVYGLNPVFDRNRQTVQLAAQMVWYFVDGFYARKMDYPLNNENDLLKYIVDFKQGEFELVFWKSKKSDRWWVQMPGEAKLSRALNSEKLVPCSYADYLMACRDELPDRWVKAYERMG